MCDPFNTSTEAALWDERQDLDPFMAEHYATNAQHELDRLLAASRPDQQRITRARHLLGTYHALAALAQLPKDSDFDNFQAEGDEEMAAVHPDRVALMGSGGEGAVGSSSSPRGRSVVTNRRDGVVDGDEGDESHSRESSVESITREDDLGDHGHGQQNYGNRNFGTQQWSAQRSVPQQHIPEQQTFQQQFLQQTIEIQTLERQILQQQLRQEQLLQRRVLQQRVPPPVYNPPPPQQMTAYYPPPQSMDHYQPPLQPPMYHLPRQSVVPYQQPNYTNMAIAAMQDIMQCTNGRSITFNFGPTVIHQYGPNIPQPQQHGPVHGSYDGGYDEILGGRRTRRGRRSRRGRR
jgi:hypothetical protein